MVHKVVGEGSLKYWVYSCICPGHSFLTSQHAEQPAAMNLPSVIKVSQGRDFGTTPFFFFKLFLSPIAGSSRLQGIKHYNWDHPQPGMPRGEGRGLLSQREHGLDRGVRGQVPRQETI